MAMAKQSDEKLWTGFGRARTAPDVLVWRPAPKRRGIDFKMAWQDVPATRSSLVSPDRNGAMVVADYRVEIHRRTTCAGLVMKKVRTYKLYVMVELVVVECREHVSRWSAGNERNRRKILARLCADCYAPAEVETAPTGILERLIRHAGGERQQPG